ncbi:MAG: hypothetical protein ACRDQG_02190 [Pseudonocardiaceae bacterium]
MITPSAPRWVLSPIDGRSHILADDAVSQIGATVALCGHVMPSPIDVSEQPPGREVCGTCEPLAVFEVPSSVFPTPTVF